MMKHLHDGKMPEYSVKRKRNADNCQRNGRRQPIQPALPRRGANGVNCRKTRDGVADSMPSGYSHSIVAGGFELMS